MFKWYVIQYTSLWYKIASSSQIPYHHACTHAMPAHCHMWRVTDSKTSMDYLQLSIFTSQVQSNRVSCTNMQDVIAKPLTRLRNTIPQHYNRLEGLSIQLYTDCTCLHSYNVSVSVNNFFLEESFQKIIFLQLHSHSNHCNDSKQFWRRRLILVTLAHSNQCMR